MPVYKRGRGFAGFNQVNRTERAFTHYEGFVDNAAGFQIAAPDKLDGVLVPSVEPWDVGNSPMMSVAIAVGVGIDISAVTLGGNAAIDFVLDGEAVTFDLETQNGLAIANMAAAEASEITAAINAIAAQLDLDDKIFATYDFGAVNATMHILPGDGEDVASVEVTGGLAALPVFGAATVAEMKWSDFTYAKSDPADWTIAYDASAPELDLTNASGAAIHTAFIIRY